MLHRFVKQKQETLFIPAFTLAVYFFFITKDITCKYRRKYGSDTS